MTRYLSAADLAARYKVGIATIWRWTKRGILPQPVRLSECVTRWDLDSIERIDAKRRAVQAQNCASVPAT